MPDTDWDTLRTFLHVARAHSFSGAAQITSSSPATISRRMSVLESDLGVTLFNRTPKGIVLTAAANTILEHISKMDDLARQVTAAAAQQMAVTGRIRISAPEGIGGYWLSSRMKEFHRLYPGVTVDVLCSLEPLDIGTMEADIFVSTHKPEHPDAVELSSGVMALKPFASVDYLEAHGTPKTTSDLSRHRICDHTNFPKHNEWEQWTNITAENPNVCYRTNSALALGEATKNGLGISLQPVGLQFREPKLRLIEIPGLSVTLKFWLSCHKVIKDVPRIRVLIDYIKSEIFFNPVPGSAFHSDT